MKENGKKENNSFGRLKVESSCLFVCDIQDKFQKHVYCHEAMATSAKHIVENCNELGMKILVTEHYRKTFGVTIQDIKLTPETPVFEKVMFSMMTTQTIDFLKNNPNIKSIILIGAEAHICVLQTCLDLLELGYEVHVLADAVTSIRSLDRNLAFKRMRQSGVYITTSEAVLFELMRDARHPKFKFISKNLTKSRIV